MSNPIPFNTKEKKHFISIINKQYNCDFDSEDAFFYNPKDRKIFLLNRKVSEIDLSKIRLNSLGLYIAQYNDDQTELRLSIEGSQLIGPIAKQNILELSKEEFRNFIRGEEFEIAQTLQGYIIIKHGPDYYGCTRIKNGVLLNFTPKIRRIKSAD